ncbi:hypothetical protein [Lysobacter gummosus]|uniref:hypothetical protein n=1 Tax=Lysobacter gummosus TaxID=262324 RepID=UPI00363894A7
MAAAQSGRRAAGHDSGAGGAGGAGPVSMATAAQRERLPPPKPSANYSPPPWARRPCPGWAARRSPRARCWRKPNANWANCRCTINPDCARAVWRPWRAAMR